MENYDTLLDAINSLRKQGYSKDFNLHADSISCIEEDIKLHPEDFVVEKYFRFEGETDPAEESVIYAISSKDGKVKGLLINAYGIYGDTISNEIMGKLKV